MLNIKAVKLDKCCFVLFLIMHFVRNMVFYNLTAHISSSSYLFLTTESSDFAKVRLSLYVIDTSLNKR